MEQITIYGKANLLLRLVRKAQQRKNNKYLLIDLAKSRSEEIKNIWVLK